MSNAARIAEQGADRCAIAGELTFAEVPQLWKQLRESQLMNRVAAVDLAAVSDADSAGLALLISWRASRQARGASLVFERVPERLLALARLTGAQSLLS